MKIINLNSKYDITQAQKAFIGQLIFLGDNIYAKYFGDSITYLMEKIPIFLVNSGGMPEDSRGDGEKPSTDYLGFYQHEAPMLNLRKPAIGLCPERIFDEVSNDEELAVLLAKVVVHEFAHAKMAFGTQYGFRDEFYSWMEESFANLITLDVLQNAESSFTNGKYSQDWFSCVHTDGFTKRTSRLSPIEYVKSFISQQPPNYKFGLELFEHMASLSSYGRRGHRLDNWWSWRAKKADISKKTVEKKEWLDYVMTNCGSTDKTRLEDLLEPLFK